MKNFSTWMLVMFMGMFWVFRVLVAVMPEFGTTLGSFVPLNGQLEIILSFVDISLDSLFSLGLFFGIKLSGKV